MARSRGKSLFLRGAFVALVFSALLAAPGVIHGGLVYFHREVERRPPRVGPGFHLPVATPDVGVPHFSGWVHEGYGGR